MAAVTSTCRAAIVGCGALLAVAAYGGSALAQEVVRVSILTYADKDAYTAGAADLPAAVALMKKAPGFVTVYPLTNDKDMSEGTVSVWKSEDDFKKLADTPEWKALLARTNPKSVDVKFYDTK